MMLSKVGSSPFPGSPHFQEQNYIVSSRGRWTESHYIEIFFVGNSLLAPFFDPWFKEQKKKRFEPNPKRNMMRFQGEIPRFRILNPPSFLREDSAEKMRGSKKSPSCQFCWWPFLRDPNSKVATVTSKDRVIKSSQLESPGSGVLLHWYFMIFPHGFLLDPLKTSKKQSQPLPIRHRS